MSSLFLLGPDPQGTCCGCETRMDPCDMCNSAVTGCACYLPIGDFNSVIKYSGFADPFISFAAAQSGAARVTGCYMSLNDFTDLSEISNWTCVWDDVAQKLTTNLTDSHIFGGTIDQDVAVCALSGSFITFTPTVVADTYATTARLRSLCDGNPGINMQATTAGTPIVLGPLPFDSNFWLLLRNSWTQTISPPTTPAQFKWEITCSNTFVPLPAVMEWFSGIPFTPYQGETIQYLDACPRLLLPILTEASNSWYTDKASAQAIITNQVSNCCGYLEPAGSTFTQTFTATNGGTSLELQGSTTSNAVQPSGSFSSITMWGSVNLLQASTLNIAYNVSSSNVGAGSSAAVANLYDRNGTLIQTQSFNWPSSAGTISFPVSGNGKYIISCQGVGKTVDSTPAVTQVNADFVITSTKTLSVNPVQALYNLGLECPARVECP